jgi:hypothetical protein
MRFLAIMAIAFYALIYIPQVYVQALYAGRTAAISLAEKAKLDSSSRAAALSSDLQPQVAVITWFDSKKVPPLLTLRLEETAFTGYVLATNGPLHYIYIADVRSVVVVHVTDVAMTSPVR